MTLLFIVWGLWFACEISLNRLFRSKGNKEKDYDKGSTAAIWRVIGIANLSAILSASFIKLPISHQLLVPYIGLFILVLGLCIRFYSIHVLGKMFTVDVNISGEHRLIKTGIYNYIRHPSYLGAIISFVGFGLSLNNWVSLAIVSTAVPAVMIHRINIEEKALHEKFGEEYELYCKSTCRLIPLIY